MKYSMVKQFSNNAMDNGYSFFYKIVDFGKSLFETFWAFFDIWATFFLIFYNMFMYVYYLFLFLIDRGSDETRGTLFMFRKKSYAYSKTPGVELSKSSVNPIPAMYGVAAKTVERVAASSPIRSTKPANAKKSIAKRVLEAVSGIFDAFFRNIKRPILWVGELIERIKHSREKASEDKSSGGTVQKKKSLIDEYLKEYESRKRA